MDEIIKRLNHLEQLIKSQGVYQKQVLTFHEACDYCGYLPSYLYRLTRSKAIPFYRPNWWKMYFRRTELDKWLLRNRITAQAGISKNPNKKGRV